MLKWHYSYLSIGSVHCSIGALSSVFDQMTSLRQEEIKAVLVDNLKQNNVSGRSCREDILYLNAVNWV